MCGLLLGGGVEEGGVDIKFWAVHLVKNVLPGVGFVLHGIQNRRHGDALGVSEFPTSPLGRGVKDENLIQHSWLRRLQRFSLQTSELIDPAF